VVFGDCHVGRSPETDAICKDLFRKLNREKGVAFAVNVGDFAERGKKEAYDRYLRIMAGAKIKIYHVPGNHDLSGGGYKYYKKNINGIYYYSFDHKNSHFIILNNAYGRSFDAKQFAWLKKDLAATKKRHIFVFMHRPTFDPGEIFGGYVMSGRERVKQLLKLFKQYHVNYVFAGHIHGYASSKRNGTVYVVSGGGGGPLHLPRDLGGFHHYVKIKVEGDEIFDKIVMVYE
jgi:3',5'-cyclic AMP phosphodiesterase CpdA